MEGDKQPTPAEGDTADKNQGGETPTVSTDAAHQEPEDPQEESQGFAARFASYLKYQKEHPEWSLEAEKERRREAGKAAWIKQRQGKETYFFYGTLMDPAIAQKVLGLETPPVMRPAVVEDRGHLRMWGPYPAFVANREPYDDIRGMACDVEGAERKDRLAAYEGEKYRAITCAICPVRDDGSLEESIYGWVFKWVGGEDELSDGTFDLEIYKKAKAELDRLDAAEAQA